MIDPAVTRRRALAGLGAAGIGTVSGCQGILGGSDGGFERWLAAPSELPGVGRYRFQVADTATLGANPEQWRGEFPVPPNARVGITTDGIERSIRVSPFTYVLEGTIPPDDITSRLRRRGYDRVGTHGGYALYASTGADVAVAVGDAVVVTAVAGGRTARLRTTIGAANGAVDRYAEKNDPLSPVVDRLRDATVGSGRNYADGNPFLAAGDDVRAGGVSRQFDGGTWRVAIMQVLSTAPDSDSPRIREWAGDVVGDQEHEVTTDGPLVAVEVQVEDRVTVSSVE